MWHVLMSDHAVYLPPTRFIHQWNDDSSCLDSPALAHYHILAGTHFPSRWR